jgi:hypothetical protein
LDWQPVVVALGVALVRAVALGRPVAVAVAARSVFGRFVLTWSSFASHWSLQGVAATVAKVGPAAMAATVVTVEWALVATKMVRPEAPVRAAVVAAQVVPVAMVAAVWVARPSECSQRASMMSTSRPARFVVGAAATVPTVELAVRPEAAASLALAARAVLVERMASVIRPDSGPVHPVVRRSDGSTRLVRCRHSMPLSSLRVVPALVARVPPRATLVSK